uniref:Uncharacterized protein n=1 Tax=Arundo donax TaxID=35708 RepID=A0A0A9CKT2_ARUDO
MQAAAINGFQYHQITIVYIILCASSSRLCSEDAPPPPLQTLVNRDTKSRSPKCNNNIY